MSITAINIYKIKAGWRSWSYLQISAKDISGWSEFSDSNTCINSTIEAILHCKDLIIGTDPDMYCDTLNDIRNRYRQNINALCAKALAALENALIDLKARCNNMSALSLIGAQKQRPIDVYWSHFGTTRIRASKVCNLKPFTKYSDLADLIDEGVRLGISSFKSNICIPGEYGWQIYMPGTGKGISQTRPIHAEMITAVEGINNWIAKCKEVAPTSEFAVDLNFNLHPSYHRMLTDKAAWYEFDVNTLRALDVHNFDARHVRVTGENLLTLDEIAKAFESPSIDIVSIDPCWIGVEKVKYANYLSQMYCKPITIHNFNSHLSTAISYSCAHLIENLHMLETDIDDVPWRDQIVSDNPSYRNGQLTFNTDKGWGCEPIIHELHDFLEHVY